MLSARKILSFSIHFLVWMLLSFLLIAAALTAGARLIGYTPYVVLSGSMEPAIPTGALIYVRATDPYRVKEGDPITFHLNQGGPVATHRVIEIDATNRYFITKGDANNSPDGMPVQFSNLIGTPRFTLPAAGFVYHALSTSPGKPLALAFIIASIAAMLAVDGNRNWKKKVNQEQSPNEGSGRKSVNKEKIQINVLNRRNKE
ncbi:MAG TPA: signal peptidase I [Bacillota bacterium]|jgi:signal peptidase|nr:signal peptidase I [Fastidiosipila sp.]HPX93366.1 signal peptidase I [Bacillota bacterium]HQB80496.1 signal peptidase I [Bacillota bacterium]